MSLKAVKGVTNVSWGTVGSVVVGLSLFGGLIYAIRRAPSNPITNVAKKAADVATSN